MCIISISISFDLIVGFGFEKLLICPCCVDAYMWREYAPVMNLIIIRGIIMIMDIDVIDVMSMISLIRLIDGGVAMFMALNMNHHMDKVGYRDNIPFIRKMLRVLVNSYVMFAKENKADEVNPCATIISIDPIIPHLEFDKMALSIKPMCPTDE